MRTLEGRCALITGSTQGLGLAAAHRFAAAGAHVVLSGLASKTEARETTAAIEAHGVRAVYAAGDLSRPGDIESIVGTARDALGGVDILVNNTGGPPPTPVAGQDAATWRTSFEQMILSVITLTDRVIPGMRERHWGRVLTSTSSGALTPIPNLGLSNTLRASLHSWSKTLAGEVGRDGITSNVIVPGRIATDRTRFLDEKRAGREDRSVEQVARESAATMALGRYGTPDEYADAAAFLCSERASYITGSVIRVDGGLIRSVI